MTAAESLASGGRHRAFRSPRSALQLAFDRSFGSLMWGKLTAATAVWMQSLVAAIVVFDYTRSAAAVAVVSIAQSSPQLLITPLAGSWADRSDSVARQILVGRLMCLLGSSALAIYFWVPGLADSASPVQLTVVVGMSVLVVGCGFAVSGPPMQSVIRLLVSDAELQVAMSLNTAPMTIARIVGPPLGVAVFAAGGAAAAFAVAAASQLVFLALLALARLPVRDRAAHGAPTGTWDGLRYVCRQRTLRILLLATAAVGVGTEPVVTLGPALAHRVGGGPALVGWMNLGFGIGSLVGLCAIGLLGRRIASFDLGCAGLALICVGLAVVALPRTGFALLGFGLTGLGFGWGMSAFSTLLQTAGDPAYRGRVMAWWLVAFVGSRPVAALCIGFGADVLGLTAGLAVAVAIGAAALVMLLGSSQRGVCVDEQSRQFA